MANIIPNSFRGALFEANHNFKQSGGNTFKFSLYTTNPYTDASTVYLAGTGNGEVDTTGGTNYSVNEVADMLGGEKTYGEKRFEPYETLADNNKAKKILGWIPKGDLPSWIKKYKKDLGL